MRNGPCAECLTLGLHNRRDSGILVPDFPKVAVRSCNFSMAYAWFLNCVFSVSNSLAAISVLAPASMSQPTIFLDLEPDPAVSVDVPMGDWSDMRQVRFSQATGRRRFDDRLYRAGVSRHCDVGEQRKCAGHRGRQKGQRCTIFTSPATRSSRRYRGRLLHRRSHWGSARGLPSTTIGASTASMATKHRARYIKTGYQPPARAHARPSNQQSCGVTSNG